MKKYLLGAVAVILALSLSAFAHQKELSGMMTNLYWFKVKPGNGAQGDFLNADITLISSVPSATPPADATCDNGVNSCIVGYDPSLMNGTNTGIDDAGGTTPVTPTDVGRQRQNP